MWLRQSHVVVSATTESGEAAENSAMFAAVKQADQHLGHLVYSSDSQICTCQQFLPDALALPNISML